MQLEKFEGVWTALTTPFRLNGNGETKVDDAGLEKNVLFQIENGANLVPTGTTGESPTLDWQEHDTVISLVAKYASESGKHAYIMAGTGSNSTKETMRATDHAKNLKLDGVLLVDCYYNGPSSLELRTQYYEPVARNFPDLFITPYIIPGRTGTKMLPEDLAILAKRCKNVRAVKEATADFDNMAKTRSLAGDDFDILSGDDDKTYEMMMRSDIKASGVVSVISNVAPRAILEMTQAISRKDYARAEKLREALNPLFRIVTVNTVEKYEGFEVACKWRNPVPIKTLMNCLGMPSGPVRQPLGQMSQKGIEILRNSVKQVYEKNPEVLMPIQEFYGINLEERIMKGEHWK